MFFHDFHFLSHFLSLNPTFFLNYFNVPPYSRHCSLIPGRFSSRSSVSLLLSSVSPPPQCQSTQKQKKKQRPAKQSVPTHQQMPPSSPLPASKEELPEEELSATRPRPPPEGEEDEAGDEQQEVASQSVKKKEEVEEEAEPDMPVVQIKPEPEEMECMTKTKVRRGRRGPTEETEGVAMGGAGGRSFYRGQSIAVNPPNSTCSIKQEATSTFRCRRYMNLHFFPR